jgi:hypothetical protein
MVVVDDRLLDLATFHHLGSAQAIARGLNKKTNGSKCEHPLRELSP